MFWGEGFPKERSQLLTWKNGTAVELPRVACSRIGRYPSCSLARYILDVA